MLRRSPRVGSIEASHLESSGFASAKSMCRKLPRSSGHASVHISLPRPRHRHVCFSDVGRRWRGCGVCYCIIRVHDDCLQGDWERRRGAATAGSSLECDLISRSMSSRNCRCGIDSPPIMTTLLVARRGRRFLMPSAPDGRNGAEPCSFPFINRTVRIHCRTGRRRFTLNRWAANEQLKICGRRSGQHWAMSGRVNQPLAFTSTGWLR